MKACLRLMYLSTLICIVLSSCCRASRPYTTEDDRGVNNFEVVRQREHTAQDGTLRKAVAQNADDFISNLPGEPEDRPFDAYGGYITVDEVAGRALYYVFISAESDDADAPVVLWLNGGPGCSSIGGGLFSELGPYYPTPDAQNLTINKYRWNRVANMIFLESPAFVGFSYSNTTADTVVGDERTAADAVQFMVGFFSRYPELASRPFWVAGESYGGHYVPNLALAIQRYNEQNFEDGINLKGFLVGNAWTDAKIDNTGAVDFWWAHAIVSDHSRNGILDYCNMSRVGPLKADMTSLASQAVYSSKCDVAVAEAMANMGNINIYDIYADVCLPKRASRQAAALGNHLLGMPAAYGLSWRVAALQHISGHYDACIDNEVAIYLNRPDVQAAMHANITGLLPGPWADCSGRVKYSREDLLSSMLPVYRSLLESDLQMLVFSGDVDAIVPVVGTRRWISSLELEIKEPWRPWISKTGQVGGYVERYNGLTFATVREAGHMVPYTQPERAYHMFERFVTGQPL